MKIEPLKHGDVESCIMLGFLMHKESALNDIPFNIPKMRSIANACLTHPDWSCHTAKVNDIVVGIVVGLINEFWFSSERYAMDLALYVHPEYRGSSAAIRLLTEFTKWCSTKNVKQIRMGESTRVNPEATKKLYEKVGFEVAGQLFVRPVH